jgi:peptide/nickel transport system permease protein
MRLGEASLALPWLYLLLAGRALLPLNLSPGIDYLVLVAVVGLLGWARPARLIRGVVLSSKERGYIVAARSFGASDAYLLRVHVMPDAFSVAATQATLLIPHYMLAEVTLSFLGLGVDEPIPSWGNMLAGAQQLYVLTSYWWMLLPALPPAIVSFCCFSMSDTLLGRRRAVPL